MGLRRLNVQCGNPSSGRGCVPAGLSRQSGYLNDLIMRPHSTPGVNTFNLSHRLFCLEFKEW